MRFKELLQLKNMGLKDLAYLGIEVKRGWKKTDIQITKEQLHHIFKDDVARGTLPEQKKLVLRKYGFTFQENNTQKLYLMSCRDLVKIGISNNPLARLRTLSTGSGDKIRLLCVWDVFESVAYVEQYLHKFFKAHWTQGEWFLNTVTPSCVEKAIPCKFNRLFEVEDTPTTEDIGWKSVCFSKVLHETKKAMLIEFNKETIWISKSSIRDMRPDLKTLKVREFVKTP